MTVHRYVADDADDDDIRPVCTCTTHLALPWKQPDRAHTSDNSPVTLNGSSVVKLASSPFHRSSSRRKNRIRQPLRYNQFQLSHPVKISLRLSYTALHFAEPFN